MELLFCIWKEELGSRGLAIIFSFSAAGCIRECACFSKERRVPGIRNTRIAIPLFLFLGAANRESVCKICKSQRGRGAKSINWPAAAAEQDDGRTIISPRRGFLSANYAAVKRGWKYVYKRNLFDCSFFCVFVCQRRRFLFGEWQSGMMRKIPADKDGWRDGGRGNLTGVFA